MNVKSISYDLLTPGRNYSALHLAIKSLSPQWCKPLESHWFVATPLTTSQILNRLTSHIDRNDKLLVVDAGPSAAWVNLPKEVADWLTTVLR